MEIHPDEVIAFLEPPSYSRKNMHAHGAISELRACAILMELGFYVYRCQSPHAPFDLVAYKDEKCWRVEVKSTTKREGYAPCFMWPKNSSWDFLVVVDSDSGVYFLFTAYTSKEAARNLIRQHYGFPPVGKYSEKLCAGCDVSFSPAIPQGVYCSKVCKEEGHKRKRDEYRSRLNLDTSTEPRCP